LNHAHVVDEFARTVVREALSQQITELRIPTVEIQCELDDVGDRIVKL
jgi:hypothetical protein